MSMSYSYKPVLILALIEYGGAIKLTEATNYFLRYYANRLEAGLVAEKSNSMYSSLTCSFDQVKANIKSNPVKALLSSADFFVFDAGSELFQIKHEYWNCISDEEIASITSACNERLDRYYRSINLAAHAEIVCFHRPQDVNGYMSNEFPAEFSAYGQSFSSLSQYMAYRKALLCGWEEQGRTVLTSHNSIVIDRIMQSGTRTEQILWEGQQIVAYQGLVAKFVQNDNLAGELLDTGSKTIVACLPQDKLWGIGMDVNAVGIAHPEEWRGHNLLGFTLMQVRSAICTTRRF